ncbi:MAG TPA: hypothetical protein VND54_13195 [Candidatus Saccharimonadales bacterium]|nr:hypothetical protein [Candidatus Saccharimonadales bacterium]
MSARIGAGRRRTFGELALSRELLLLASLTVLSIGSTIRLGTYSPSALELVVLAALLMAGTLVSRNEASAGTLPWVVLGGGTAAVVLIYADPLGLPRATWLAPVLVVAVVCLLMARASALRWIAAAIAACALSGMLVLALLSKPPGIDVFQTLQGASSALIHGQSPYQPTFPVEVAVTPFTFANVPAHFGYLPVAALITVPGRLLGDVRLMSVVALVALIAFAVRLACRSTEPRTRVVRVGALCLALPMTVAIVYFSWVDIYSMAGFAGWIVLRDGHRRWSIALLVITLTVKPVILIALVPALLWSRRARFEALVAALIAIVLILPFALAAGIANFYQDIIGVQASQNFRGDGLTLNSAWYAVSGHTLPVWLGLAAGAVVAVYALRRRPRDIADLLCSGALLSTAAFLLAKWAFLNYYFIPVWLLVFALAGRGVPFEESAADLALPGAGVVFGARGVERSP